MLKQKIIFVRHRVNFYTSYPPVLLPCSFIAACLGSGIGVCIAGMQEVRGQSTSIYAGTLGHDSIKYARPANVLWVLSNKRAYQQR
jgi:hypothetical protein